MSFFPRAQNDTTPGGMSVSDDSYQPFPLLQVDLPQIKNLRTHLVQTGAGVLVLDNPVGGHFVYQPVPADWPIPGEYQLIFRCVGIDGSVRYTDKAVGTVTAPV